MTKEPVSDKNVKMGSTTDVEKLLLNTPVDGGKVLVRRSVENGVETLIMLSKPKETSAA
jgi:CxxC motif-containing protein